MTETELHAAIHAAAREHSAGRFAEAETMYRRILAAHPDDVFTAGSNNYVTWDRGLSSFNDMVNFWSGLGFLVQSGDVIIETERTL